MGKARAFSTEGEDANYLRESEDETYKVTQQNSYNLGSTTFSDQSGIGNFAQSGTDQRKANLTGALFRGNIGFLLQSAVLDDTTNTINLLEDQSGNPVPNISTDRIVIISGFAVTADLEIILGAQRPGQRLVLYNTDGNTITIKDASTAASPTDPNLIHTPGGLDYIISGFDSVQLVFDSIEEQWRIVGAVGTGGGTGYDLIQDEGISLTQRTTMNFIGNSVTAVDNPGQSRTDITINTPSGTIPDGTAENQHLEWDNSFLTWNAVDALTFGTTGPFAASGFLRTANDEIIFASRNAGDSDDIRLKINASDRFIFEFPGSVVPLEVASNLIDVKTVDIVNIDRAKFVTSSGSMVPNSDTGILLNSNNQFQFNTSDTSDFTFTFDNNDPSFVIDRLTASNDSTLVSVLSDETDINSQSFLNITKSFSIPLSLQEIGSLNFIAGNSVGSTLFEYASIIGKIEDTTNGSIDGSMILNATINDSVTAFIQLNNSSDGIIKALKDVTLENLSLNPVLTFFRNQTGVTDNPLGNIVFKGLQSNDNPFIYSTISSVISDATLGQEDSIITLSATNDGLLANVQLIVNADSSQILRFDSTSPSATFASPVFELLATVGIVPPTGAVQRIGEMNFEATTNDAGGIGAVETFAQIIVDQEESDITNESGSMRFRLRDQTPTTGSLKTYLRFNDASNGRIDALKNLAMTGNDVIGIQALGFNEIGGQIAVADDSAGFNFVTLSDRPFRFTPNATNVLDIDDTGLTMLSGNIELGNGNVTGVNQIAFNQTGQTITDDVNGLRFSLPDFGDTYDFEINGTVHFSLEDFFANWFDTVQQYNERADPASPPVGDVFFYAKLSDGIAKLFYKQSDGTVIGPLGIGGGGTGGGVVGESIVKAIEEPITNDTTLTLDDEFQFIPEANTIYFIEWNIRYDSSFTQIKVAVEGGADMSYQIVAYNTSISPNNWSEPSLSNVEFLPFASTGSSTEEDSHSVQFYAIVTVGNDTDALGLSWAQLSSNFSQTVIRVGSLMRIYAEGINGGGSPEINDYTVSNTQSEQGGGFLDTKNDFIGINNGQQNLGISLGTSDPGIPTVDLTLTASQFPEFTALAGVLEYVEFGVEISALCNNSGSTTNLVAQGYINGAAVSASPFTAFASTSSGNNAQGTCFISDTNIGVGTTIGIACWTTGGTSMDLEDFAVWVFPTKIRILGRNFQLAGGSTTSSELTIMGDDPPGITNEASLGFFVRYDVNGPFPAPRNNVWNDDEYQAVQGVELNVEDSGENINFAANQGADDNLFVPGLEGFRFLRFVK